MKKFRPVLKTKYVNILDSNLLEVDNNKTKKFISVISRKFSPNKSIISYNNRSPKSTTRSTYVKNGK